MSMNIFLVKPILTELRVLRVPLFVFFVSLHPWHLVDVPYDRAVKVFGICICLLLRQLNREPGVKIEHSI